MTRVVASPPGAFARLRTLLADVAPPPDRAPVNLHLGECRLGTPEHLLTALADPQGWTGYPPPGGTPALRTAYRGWLSRRFGPEVAGVAAVEPTPGSKQAVATLLALAVADRAGPAGAPAVVLPNPAYPTYLAGAHATRARAVPYPVAGPGGTEVAAAVAAAVRAGGPVAAVVVCHPGNPLGELLDTAALRSIARTTARAGALLVVDECYVDLWTGTRPTGYLAAVPDAPGPFAVLHTLSKRSAAPGLRSGFAAGDAATVARYAAHNRACGVSNATPVCAAAAALWTDDAHVGHLRDEIARSWGVADALLADLPGYRQPPAGFFLWLPLPGGLDDEDLARRLWKDHAVSVMPGCYLAQDDSTGTNPGAGHVRVTLAHPAELLRPALSALRAAVLAPLTAEAPSRIEEGS